MQFILPKLYINIVNFPGEGNGKPLQYPCLENSVGRGAWWAAVHGHAKSRAGLSDKQKVDLKTKKP